MSLYLLASAVLGAVLLGFLAGLFLFKVKSRWCRRCGGILSCPDCGSLRTTSRPAARRLDGQP